MNRKKKTYLFNTKIAPEYKYIYIFIYSRLDRDKELANDITQDTMEMAWHKIDQLQNVESPRAWLIQIAVNEIRKYFRARKAQKRSLFQEQSYELHEFENLETPEQVEADVLDTIIALEDRKLLMHALEQVPEHYRILLELRLIQDLKFSQIADIMQMDVGKIRVYYGRGVKLLSKVYHHMIGEDDK